jgi:hypothetical protein
MIIQTIPLRNIPNQQVTTIVNGQQITIEVYQMDSGMYCNIFLGTVLIIAGMACNNGVYINQYPTGFIGYLFFWNINENQPNYTTLGTESFLIFSDTDLLALNFADWVSKNVS